MSYSEMINYEALSLQCKAVCGVAQKEVRKIDELLQKINITSSSLLTPKIKEYEAYLIKEKGLIEKQIEVLLLKADEQAKLGSKRMKLGAPEEEHYKHRMDLIHQAHDFQNHINEMFTSKMEVLNQLINDELQNTGEKADQFLRNQAYGVVELSDKIIMQISTIADASLRELVYREAIQWEHKDATFDQLLDLGEKRLDEMGRSLIEKNRERILEGIRKDMEAARIDTATINHTLSSSSDLQSIKASANQEIVGEEVRKESLKVILKAIEARGFMVDRKTSIKIDRDKNEVHVIGKKASGQTAEFTIYLDGRFSYKFDGFEGQACQKDIEPFMSDLEDIYGMKITGRLELWKNPDKLSSQKYQTINTNKGNL